MMLLLLSLTPGVPGPPSYCAAAGAGNLPHECNRLSPPTGPFAEVRALSGDKLSNDLLSGGGRRCIAHFDHLACRSDADQDRARLRTAGGTPVLPTPAWDGWQLLEVQKVLRRAGRGWRHGLTWPQRARSAPPGRPDMPSPGDGLAAQLKLGLRPVA